MLRRFETSWKRAEHPDVTSAITAITSILAGGQRPSQQGIAQLVGLSASDLARLLVFEMGRTFVQCRSVVAIMLGAQRLAASTKQVAEIAYALGFQHPAQFDREFHRTLGLSPSGFRKLLKLI